ncbi:hypothetical protein MBOVJF4428_00168 [Mycoplasmopsis agalactiae]|uniref:Uncharacterized protein n=1 Tax=Mycoplasmopsis agalactiae (strain NCTC 10123 / CIP 59.7 / PG2) TaxID=347257 RepID=A5IYP2_MYCAP|nr:hypothetical protein [Mycoplasmopsis agalactiae]MCE6057191.1 hypothetical protein [Mycoplasmopsis agalactiae]MCE6078977.1 hypothetical protein [Mycoplasmopsis agalactiae]MCE6095363.1 hypothetical protein [Mycoplasmopsis agalactiae]MCE6114620.1 hypothetical protein [Mycoplasmopsis agalactiae]NLS34540.1 hypothetical protein [Mycoplasmopsis agalactiae]
MTLNEKIKYINDNNFIKEKLNLHYFLLSLYSLFFTAFLVLIIFFSSRWDYSLGLMTRISEKNPLGYLISFLVFFVIGLVTFGILFINCLMLILVNKMINYNMFRALRCLKIKLFFSAKFQILLKLNKGEDDLKPYELDFLAWVKNKGFVLSDSKAISYLYGNYWRRPKVWTFVANSSRATLKDYEIYAGGTIFSKEPTRLKVKVNNQEMHFSLVKLIPDKYIKNKLVAKVPNSSWILASLTFKLMNTFLRLKKDKHSEELINMVERLFNDLTYIFNKKIIFRPKNHLDVFKSNYIFWFFDSYFSNSELFNFCDDEQKDEFLEFLNKFTNRFEYHNEVINYFKALFIGINSNEEFRIIVDTAIKLNSQNKHLNLTKRFRSVDGKINFMRDNYPEPITNELIKIHMYDFWKEGQKNNEIDSRIILLKEFNKSLENNKTVKTPAK